MAGYGVSLSLVLWRAWWTFVYVWRSFIFVAWRVLLWFGLNWIAWSLQGIGIEGVVRYSDFGWGIIYWSKLFYFPKLGVCGGGEWCFAGTFRVDFPFVLKVKKLLVAFVCLSWFSVFYVGGACVFACSGWRDRVRGNFNTAIALVLCIWNETSKQKSDE